MDSKEIDRQVQAVIAEALTWEKTPYLHGECIKGVAISCASFIVESFNRAIGTHLTVEQYPEQWYLNEKVQRYLNSLRAQGFVEIPRKETRAGDLIISRPYCEIYSHGGILLAPEHPVSVSGIHCSKKGVQRVHNLYSTYYFGHCRNTHMFFRWGGWI